MYGFDNVSGIMALLAFIGVILTTLLNFKKLGDAARVDERWRATIDTKLEQISNDVKRAILLERDVHQLQYAQGTMDERIKKVESDCNHLWSRFRNENGG
jgi:hypothetical protein